MITETGAKYYGWGWPQRELKGSSQLLKYMLSHHDRVDNLLHLGVEDSLGEDLLGDLGTHISISRLRGNEDTSNFALLGVDLVHLHFDSSLSDIEGLVVLLEELSITLLSRLKTRKGNGHVVTGGSTASLGVKEKTSAVGRNGEVASHLEARLEGSSVALGYELLDGEKEGNTLASRQLDGGGGVVDSLLLSEDDVSSVHLDASLNSLEGVGLTGHDLGVDELLLRLASLADLLLDGPGLRLDAHLGKAGSRLGDDGVLTDDLRAAVGESSSLNLEVGELVELGLGDGLRGEGGAEDGDSCEGGGADPGHVVLHGIELGGTVAGRTGGEGIGGGREGNGAGSGELHLSRVLSKGGVASVERSEILRPR